MKQTNSIPRWCLAAVLVATALLAVKIGRKSSVSSAAPVQDKRFDADRPVITKLLGKHHTLTISSSGNGPVYSVADAQGKTLLSGASADQLRAAHPDLYKLINATTAGANHPVIDASIGRD